MSDKKYLESFKIFKPNKSKNGCASQWQFNNESKCIFVEFANQKSNVENISFDWQNKIIMKLDVTDIGEILSTINKNQNGLGLIDKNGKHKGLFHQTPKGNTILQMAEGNNKNGFFIRISQKLKNDQNAKICQHSMTYGEASTLEVLLRCAIEEIYEWQNR